MPDGLLPVDEIRATVAEAGEVVDEILDSLPGEVGSVREALERLESLRPMLEERFPVAEDYFNLGYTRREALLRDVSWTVLHNRLMRAFFDAVPAEERGVFLPHCLCAPEGCARKRIGPADVCARCGNCMVDRIVEAALAKGYREDRVLILGGGSILEPLVKESGIRAMVGVACNREALLYLDRALAGEFGIPSQVALLHRWGCRETDVVLDLVEEAL